MNQKNPSKIIAMHKAMNKYFPNAVAGDYLGDMNNVAGTPFIPGLDIAFFTGYTIFHNRPHAWTYSNLIANVPTWKNAGKTVYLTTEASGAACKVNISNTDMNTAQKVSDRQISQIVMGILGGAQGVFHMLINMQRELRAKLVGQALSRNITRSGRGL
jgi:hypothetical protein